MSALDPILPGFYPDPSICRVGEDYYLVTSSFHYFPGVPIFHSRDLVNWTQIGHCLTRPEQLPLEGAKTSAGIYAPAIRWHDGTSYGHMVTIARSDTPWGPWEECPHNPILTHRSLDIPVQATGHGDLVETPDGDWWMVFLGVRPDMGHPRAYHLGRETFIAPVRWENGWPVVAENGRLTSETPLPAKRETDTEWSDDFTGTDFKSEWNFLRNPESANYRLDGKGLRLCGTETLLDDAASPTWIGRRQQHLTCTFSAEMDWQVGGAGRAGLSVYMDEAHHYDLTITPDGEGGFQGEVRLRIGPLTQVVASRKFAGSRACLAVKADPQTYFFGLIVDGEFEPLTTARVRYLTTEVAQGFTGVYFALFAEGTGVECTIRQVRYLL